MLNSFFQNMNAGVTKSTYFEICEQLGTEPVDSEIPVEFDDFPDDIQLALTIYFKLRDEWDGFSGTYQGKNFSGLADVFDIYQITGASRQEVLDWIIIIDKVRAKIIQDSKPKDTK